FHSYFGGQLQDKVLGHTSSELRDLRAEQQGKLSRYQWVNKKDGVVRIPVDRAIEITLADYRARAKKAAEAAGLDGMGERLLDRLKALRLDLAKERGVPAYVVFSDRSLIDMADKKPRSAAEFAEIYGVGAAKQRDFAEIFLAAIAEAEAA
ncbi:MAG: HRDC domain-containing protein, partial [Myxococcales bacterium]|nr:HRDC domain-containing protein [Myxococcales bacterium]